MNNYRLIEEEGVSIELSDYSINQIHFIGENVIVLRKYKDGSESVSTCKPMSVKYYSNQYKKKNIFNYYKNQL